MRNTLCTIFAFLSVISAVSCGRTVQTAGRNSIGSYDTPQFSTEPSEFATEEITDVFTEPPTEPPTEGNPEPVVIDPNMPDGYKLSDSCIIEGFETVLQCPELPTGCEITALTQTLNFYGFGIDKAELCDTFMPIDINGYYTMNEVYLGDPRATNGFGCNAPVIKKVADDYFDYLGSDWYALDLTGISLNEIFYQVEQGRPVVVWSTIGQRESNSVYQFTLGCGEDFYFNFYQHCLTVYGFDYKSGIVYAADPLEGNMQYEMDRFERVYESMGKQAVILCGNTESAGEDYTTDEEKDEWLEENKPKELEHLVKYN